MVWLQMKPLRANEKANLMSCRIYHLKVFMIKVSKCFIIVKVLAISILCTTQIIVIIYDKT